jgi:nuclear cap-binding protein subunit 1
LSNFQFRWSWEDWESCLLLDQDHPRPKFIKEVLLKAQRLAYHERIHKIVPESYESLIPEKPESFFKYGANLCEYPFFNSNYYVSLWYVHHLV